jgi:hypothetical protein
MAKLKTREIAPLSFRAAIVPGSIDEEKRTVDLVWSTGARVLRGSFDPYFEELSMKPSHVRMERLKSGNTPLLNSHRSGDLADVIGVVEKASLAKGEGRATVRFSAEPDADAIFRKVVERIVKNVSVGYRTFKLEQVREKGADPEETPTFRATDWEPHELSMVPIGADAGASVRNQADQNPCEFIELANDKEQRDMDPKTAPEAIPADPKPVAPVAPAGTPALSADEKRVLLVADRKRTADIRRVASHLDIKSSDADKAIADGVSIDAFRAQAFDDYAARSELPIPDTSRPDIMGGDDEKDKTARAMGNWLIVRSSNSSVIEEAAKRRGEKVDLDPGQFRGMTLLDMCRASLESAGESHRGLSKLELAGKALSHRSGGMNTTTDFPVVLEEAMHKLLLGAYATTPDTWSRFCATGSVGDFRAHNRYRLGSFGALDTVAEHGEFQNKSIPDGRKETITATTKGNIIALSRQAIINDDMDAFTKLSAQLGRAARLSIEMDVYALLALNAGLGPDMQDGNPLFDASHANIGAGVALSVGAVDADRILMKSQTDDSGNEILDISPAVLLVAAGLASLAKQINAAEFDLSDVGGFAPNTSRGMFRDIVDTARLTGTRRYTFADPNIAPTLEVAFLDGQQEPFLEMQEGYRIDGVTWKVRLDYAVAGIDYKGATTDAGV